MFFDPGDLLKREMWTPSAIMLVAGNAVAIVFALIQGMDPASVVWAYWLESVIIGLYTVFTFGTISLRSLGRREIKAAGKGLFMAGFFTIHYGMFHAVYSLFLYVMPWFTPDPADFPDILLLAGIFFITHGYSFVRNFLSNPARLENTEENLGEIMQAPYGRIIPMHVAIILSGFVIGPLSTLVMVAEEIAGEGLFSAAYILKLGALLVFMALKTIADVAGHIMRYRKGAAR